MTDENPNADQSPPPQAAPQPSTPPPVPPAAPTRPMTDCCGGGSCGSQAPAPPQKSSCCGGGSCGGGKGKCGAGKGCALTGCGLLAIIPIVLGALFLLTLVGGMMSTASGSAHKPKMEDIVKPGDSANKIVVISVHGVIFGGQQEGFGPPPLATRLLEELDAIEKDKNVVGVILDMNTPGGEVTATDEVHHKIQQLRKTRGIKFVTCMRTVAASGGYYLAAGTDHIVANRLTMTGSIGVIMQGFNVSELLDKIGVQAETYAKGDRKDLLNASRKRQQWEIDLVNEMVDEMYGEFAQIVADGRNLEVSTVKSFEASVFSGRKALANGLVDELGYMEDAIAAAHRLTGDANASIVRYRSVPSLAGMFFGATAPQTNLEKLAGELTPTMQAGVPYYMLPTAR